jgi:hypothetical protein
VNAAPIVTVSSATGSPPAQTGGALVPGTYFATRATEYSGGGGPFGARYRETAVVTASTIQAVIAQDVGDGGLSRDQPVTFTYTASGSSLTVTPTCGLSGGTIVQPYTSSTPPSGPTTIVAIVNGNVLLELTKQ